jgi:hypothetical protein
MENLPGPTGMTRYFPETDDGLARRSFALHIYPSSGWAGFGSLRTQERIAAMDFGPGKPGARFVGLNFLPRRR